MLPIPPASASPINEGPAILTDNRAKANRKEMSHRSGAGHIAAHPPGADNLFAQDEIL